MIKLGSILQQDLPAPAGGSALPGVPSTMTGGSAHGNTQSYAPKHQSNWDVPSVGRPGFQRFMTPSSGMGAPGLQPTTHGQTQRWLNPQGTPQGGLPWAMHQADRFGRFVANPMGNLPPGTTLPNRYNFLAGSKAPPLGMLTHHLGESIKPIVDKGLGFIQNTIASTPESFAGFAGGLMPGVAKGLMSMGPLSPALLGGAYGLLRGGESFAALDKFTQPLQQRLGFNLGDMKLG